MKWNDVERELLKDIETRKRYNAVDLAFEISKMIIDARLAKDMTQKELAEALDTKQPAIARLESGSYVPSFRMLQQLADVFGVKLVPPRFEEYNNGSHSYTTEQPAQFDSLLTSNEGKADE